ncbi:MAG: Na(+)/H(+) antiporter subunit D [Betaproteobacteria bacterium]|nr:Na(+)/H(+) antiporter subunit D [Betaproteobacteria bacterium]
MAMTSLLAHPTTALFLGAVLVAILKGQARSVAALVAPLLALWLVWQVPEGIVWQTHFLGVEITPFAVDRLSRLFATIFSIMVFSGALFSLNQTSRLELPAAFVYAGSAIGVTFARDLVTVFLFWELMAIGSTLVIWSAGTRRSYAASMRYLMVHLTGGVLLLIGVTAFIAETGQATFGAMTPHSVGTWFILAAFLVNAGAPPLSAWLPDAYPEASWSGTVFLSAFTTKTAVYALLRGFPGAEILVFVGLFMVFYGILYALLENDMRRILSYSIVNQVGFMVTGIGIGTEMALNGAAAHAFAHIMYKALLLMSAGSVFYVTGKRKCTDLGGIFRTMPLTAICGIVGALAISAFPLTSGFISKSMIAQAAADRHMTVAWLLLAAASAGVFLHAGIKFPWFVFFQKDSGLRPPEPPLNMRIAMILLSVVCVGLGVFYEPLYHILPYATDYRPYTADHVVTQLQLLLFAGLAFFVMLGWLRRTLTISLDFDWFYRRLGPALVRIAEAVIEAGRAAVRTAVFDTMRAVGAWLVARHRPDALLARTWSTSGMALGVMLILLAYLVGFYVL